MKILTLEFFKTSEKLPEIDSPLIIQLKNSLRSGWFHGKVFETDSEYIYEIDEVDSWAYLPKVYESEGKDAKI